MLPNAALETADGCGVGGSELCASDADLSPASPERGRGIEPGAGGVEGAGVGDEVGADAAFDGEADPGVAVASEAGAGARSAGGARRAAT